MVELGGDALGDGPRGDAARLRMADKAAAAPADVEADLGDLRGLTRTGFASDDDDLVFFNRCGDIVLAGADWQGIGVGELGDGGIDKREAICGSLDILADFAQGLGGACLRQAAAEAAGLGDGDVV